MIPLEPTRYFHVYNRANGFEKLFITASNYSFFLGKYKLYVSPYAETYCYCLMPNHVHFLLQIRSEEEIEAGLLNAEKEQGTGPLEKFRAAPEKFISKQFSNLFSSYAQAFNKQQRRMGSLFMKNFNRKPVTDEVYLKKLVHYIHNNPVQAGLCKSPEGWVPSSYSRIVNNDLSFTKGQEVVSWFDDLENFQAFHRLPPSLEDSW